MVSNSIAKTVRLLIPNGGTAENAIKSGVWSSLANVLERLLQIAKLIILARILEPADFGLMGIALLVLASLQQLLDLGVEQALIQRSGETIDTFLNTAWCLKIIRGLCIGVVVFLLAPLAAQFFNEPRAMDIIRAVAFVPLIVSFSNPGVVYFQKNLDFHKEFIYKMTGTALNVLVSVITALILRSVWAFVFGALAGKLTTAMISYILHDYRPYPEFDREKAREIIGFGKWILFSSAILFFATQGDDAFVGWFLGAGALGFYQVAYRLSSAPSSEITGVVSQVVFPTYSKVQDDVAKLQKAFYRTVQLVALLAIPMTVGIVVVTPSFVHGFLGGDWEPMILSMQVLAIWGGIRALSATVGPLFQAIGQPEINAKLQAIWLVLIAISIYPTTDAYGITGTGLVIVGTGFVMAIANLYIAMKKVDGKLSTLLRDIMYPSVASLGMIGAVVAADLVLPAEVPLFKFATFVGLGIVVYATLIIGMNRHLSYDVDKLIRTISDEIW